MSGVTSLCVWNRDCRPLSGQPEHKRHQVKDALGFIVSLCRYFNLCSLNGSFTICGEEHLKRFLVLMKASRRLSFQCHFETCLLHKNKFTLKIKKDWAGEMKGV